MSGTYHFTDTLFYLAEITVNLMNARKGQSPPALALNYNRQPRQTRRALGKNSSCFFQDAVLS